MGIYFNKELAELRAKGIGLADLTADEVVELVRATDRLRNPFSNVNLCLCGQPRQVAPGIAHWPFTVGASVWLDEYARVWWRDRGRSKAYYWAIVYALVHGRDKDAFTRMTTEPEAYEAIKRMALEFPVRDEELERAVDDCLGITRHDDGKPKRGPQQPEHDEDWSNIVRVLEVRTGIPAETWLWNRARDYVAAAFREAQRVVTAFGETKMPRMKNELDYAVNAIARLRASIVARVERERAGRDSE